MASFVKGNDNYFRIESKNENIIINNLNNRSDISIPFDINIYAIIRICGSIDITSCNMVAEVFLLGQKLLDIGGDLRDGVGFEHNNFVVKIRLFLKLRDENNSKCVYIEGYAYAFGQGGEINETIVCF